VSFQGVKLRRGRAEVGNWNDRTQPNARGMINGTEASGSRDPRAAPKSSTF
jgi:hypothetical protein